MRKAPCDKNPCSHDQQTNRLAANRMGVWKGMLRIELDTPAEDAAAGHELSKTTP